MGGSDVSDQRELLERDQPEDVAIPAMNRALDAGRRAFGPRWQPTRLATAPGRLELLGNHIDYNGGPVLAAAIDRFVVAALEESDSVAGDIQVAMADSPESATTSIVPETLHDWQNESP